MFRHKVLIVDICYPSSNSASFSYSLLVCIIAKWRFNTQSCTMQLGLVIKWQWSLKKQHTLDWTGKCLLVGICLRQLPDRRAEDRLVHGKTISLCLKSLCGCLLALSYGYVHCCVTVTLREVMKIKLKKKWKVFITQFTSQKSIFKNNLQLTINNDIPKSEHSSQFVKLFIFISVWSANMSHMHVSSQ